MKKGTKFLLSLVVIFVWLNFCLPLAMAVQDGGYTIVSSLWAKAVLKTSAGDFTLIWVETGNEMTPSGDQVVSGYFYTDPNDFAYGSQYNPEAFVKVYITKDGWADIVFNHVTVDDVDVFSANGYSGNPDQTGVVTLDNRLAEHQYTGISFDPDSTSPGTPSDAAPTDGGYTLGSNLWSRAIFLTPAGDITLVWKEIGSDITPSGDQVISGYFYADPNDFPYGSVANPEAFVKLYITTDGWANIVYNHVTVDDVRVESAYDYTGSIGQSGIITLNGRLAEQTYTDVPIDVGIFEGRWDGKTRDDIKLGDSDDAVDLGFKVLNGKISGISFISNGTMYFEGDSYQINNKKFSASGKTGLAEWSMVGEFTSNDSCMIQFDYGDYTATLTAVPES